MSRTDVLEMVSLCRGLGLAVQFETGSTHYSVRDPDSDAKLFYISSTPSDSNFKYEIARHLRRLGLLKGNLKFGKFTQIKRKKKYGAIDLNALRKAQEQAEAAGYRVPLLEDLNDGEFLRQSATGVGVSNGYVKEAQEEAIQNMAMKLSPRGSATKQRLRKYFNENPKFTNTQFVKTAMEVAEKRSLRSWPSLNSGQQSLGAFKNDDDSTLQIWGMNLVEATLDHLEGMRWDTEPPSDPQREPEDDTQQEATEPTPPFEPEYITEETLGNILGNFKVEIINEMQTHLQERVNDEVDSLNGAGSLREKYAETLLRLLETDTQELPEILSRLDKLVGL